MAACVVCAAAAKVYCEADKAFLCTECDRKVHSSNMLAARHVRQPICELCKALVCTVYCCNDAAYLCDACSDAVHTDNMLAARHTIVPAAQALATEAPETLTKEDDTTDALSSVEKPLTTTGSEAVVPSLSDPISAPNVPNEMDKGIFGKDSFGKAGDIAEFLDLDNSWLDGGLDLAFGDFLQDDAGLVPNFEGSEEVDLEQPPLLGDEAEDDYVEQAMSNRQVLAPMPAEHLNLDFSLAAPCLNVPFDGPPAMHTERSATAPVMSAEMAMLPPVMTASSFPPGMLFATVYPAIQASQYYPDPSAFPRITREQATKNREVCLERYREKRKHRKFEKTIRYASRKAYAEVRPRIKGRFARKDELEAWARGEGPLAEMGLVYNGQSFD